MFLFQKSLEVMQGHGNLKRRERNDMDKTTSKTDSPEKKKRKINDETSSAFRLIVMKPNV